MRKLTLAVLTLFLTTAPLSATEEPPTEELQPPVVPSVVVETEPTPGPGMHLVEVNLEERAAPADDAIAQLGPRGGFWWVVGVIVVAGVILALIL